MATVPDAQRDHVEPCGAPLMSPTQAWVLGRLAAGEWWLSPADAEAVRAVLARLAAPLPERRGRVWEGERERDRGRRLQRIVRTSVHHLDAGAVSPPAAALLASVARALLPWHDAPNPPLAAAAPRYATAAGETAAGEALLPGLIELFTALVAASCAPGAIPRKPYAEPWEVRYAGRFRCHSRPAPGVWAVETVTCPACGAADGPWTVACDGSRTTLTCTCGAAHGDHGLAPSEILLVLPETG